MSDITEDRTTAQVDVRGPRFVAWVTTVVLVATLLASGVQYGRRGRHPWRPGRGLRDRRVRGPGGIPTACCSRSCVAPRLGPVTEREPVPR